MTDIVLKPDREIVDYIVEKISDYLVNGKSVLWLIPGGSASVVAIDALRRLEAIDTSELYITLTDERYGTPSHPNENWIQLQNAGFPSSMATTYRVLTGDTEERTVDNFSFQLQQWLAQTDFSIGLFGIGADGHTAGIKPGSPAVESEDRVVYFKGEDFERITITPAVIRELDEVVAYACGKAKFPTLERLLAESLPIAEQPAQALKLAKQAVLFSDYQQQ